jgi:hypothetical protein
MWLCEYLYAIIDKRQKNITQICFICTIEIGREQPVGKKESLGEDIENRTGKNMIGIQELK